MPAPLDLTGRRFGKLVAVKRVERSDRRGTWWLCRCDCGGEQVAPTNRLNISDEDPRALRACEACRSSRCAVCGAMFLKAGSGVTCGADACRREVARASSQRGTALEEERSPGIIAARQRARIAKLRSDPIAWAAHLEADKVRARRARREMTPDERDARRARSRERYRANRDEMRDYFRRWIDAMSPEQRARWDLMAAEATRRYRSRRALAQMMRDAQRLIDGAEDE